MKEPEQAASYQNCQPGFRAHRPGWPALDGEAAGTSMFANVAAGHSQEEALRYVEEISKDLSPGCRVVLGGASLAFRESMRSLLFALVLGIIVA